MILKNPNSDEFYERAKKSHLKDIEYLTTKGASTMNRDEKIQQSKIWYRY